MDKGSIRRDIKWNAKRMMSGNYGAMIAIMFIYLGVGLAIGMVINAFATAVLGAGTFQLQYTWRYSGNSAVMLRDMLYLWGGVIAESLLMAAVSLFITMPLTFGVLDWYRELSLGRKQNVGAIFNYFGSGKLYLRAVKVALEQAVKVFLWTLLCSVVFVFLAFGYAFLVYWCEYTVGDMLLPLVILLGIVLYAAILLTALLITVRYTLIVYTSVRNKDWKNREVFRTGVGYMKEHYWETIGYELSFLPWYLLTVLTCGVLVIYLAPYKRSADILYYNYLFETGEARKNGTAMPYTGLRLETAETVEEERRDEPAQASSNEPWYRIDEDEK